MSNQIELARQKLTDCQPFSEFAQDMLRKMATGFGITYEQLCADYRSMKPLVTAKMLRLAMSGDRRKWKRAWRIYLQVNGREAPRSYFAIAIGNHIGLERKRVAENFGARLYEIWLSQVVDTGKLHFPPGAKREGFQS